MNHFAFYFVSGKEPEYRELSEMDPTRVFSKAILEACTVHVEDSKVLLKIDIHYYFVSLLFIQLIIL